MSERKCSVADVLSALKEGAKVPEGTTEVIDDVLLEIIKVEKKHLFGMEQSSNHARVKDIEKVLDRAMSKGAN